MEDVTEKLKKIAETKGKERKDDIKEESNDKLELVDKSTPKIKLIPELEYEIEKITLTKKSVEEMVIVNPRRLHLSQVQSIYKALLKGKHFDSVFVVNRRDNKLRVIDGNHRIEALMLFFKKRPHMKLEAFLAVYNNLGDAQEREIFTRWNISITQSTDDFINSYKETIPMYSRFVDEMPCSIYGSNNKMKLRDMVNAYSASFENPYAGGERKTKIDFIQYLQRMTNSDLDAIIRNFNILKAIFDTSHKKDWRKQAPFRNIIYRALYYLVANNIDQLDEPYITRRMRTALAGRTIMDEYRRYSGRRASVDAYLAFKAILNDCPSEKKFI